MILLPFPVCFKLDFSFDTAVYICSSNVYEVPTSSCVNMLNESAVNIEETPLGDYGYDETDGGVNGGGGEEEDEVEEAEGTVFETSQANKRPRAMNYTQLEDVVLI